MKPLTLILLVFLMASCGPRKITIKETVTVTDTITTTVKEIKRDTVIRIQADSLRLRATLDQLRQRDLRIRSLNGRITGLLSIKGDTITADCLTDSLQLEIELRDKLITTLQKRLEQKETVREVPVPFTPWYVKILAWIGGIAIFGAALLLGFKYLFNLKPF